MCTESASTGSSMSTTDSSQTPTESIKPSKRSRPPGDRATISMHLIAQRFRRAREEAGLTLRETAERAELAPSTIQKIENQRIVPSIAVALRLANALNRRASYFIEEDQQAPPDVRFIPRGRGRRLGQISDPVSFQQIAEPLANPRMEAYLVTVQPGGRATAASLSPIGEKRSSSVQRDDCASSYAGRSMCSHLGTRYT